jgi:hypothetical protein
LNSSAIRILKASICSGGLPGAKRLDDTTKAAAASIAARDPSSVCTGAMMSMTGFAGSSGTAVLPMCSIDPASQGARTFSNSKRSASNLDGHESS